MRIVQLLTGLLWGDGIGNEAIEIDNILKKNGIDTMIYATTIASQIDSNIVDCAINFPILDEDDIVIFHFSIGTELCELVKYTKAHVILMYHSITPEYYFDDYNEQLREACALGRKQLYQLRSCVEYCLVDSENNKKQLIEIGYKCEIDVQPIIVQFSQYNIDVSNKVINAYDHDKVNLLFVGRIAPNKKQKDIISAFFKYKQKNKKSRLILLGEYETETAYFKELCEYIKSIDLQDVVFTGSIPFEEILAYYSLAHIFVCLSEHEEFCSPLLEAMYFNIPILAYNSANVTEVIDGASIVVRDKIPEYIALWVKYILNNYQIKNDIIKRQRKRLESFEYDMISNVFWERIKKKKEEWDVTNSRVI